MRPLAPAWGGGQTKSTKVSEALFFSSLVPPTFPRELRHGLRFEGLYARLKRHRGRAAYSDGMLQREDRISLSLGGQPPPIWAGLLTTLVAVAVGTLLVYPLKSVAPVVSLGVVYLPAILLISILWGWRLGLLASVASAIAFNFFQIPPLYRFTIAEEQNWVALAAFAMAAIISSAVAELARAGAVEAEHRREEAACALSELETRTRERDRMQAEAIEAEALRRSDELKTALLRAISHDLRTPLTSIIAGGSALGSRTLTAEERAELSEAIVAEGTRLSRLVENLLDMSRLEAGKADPHREPIDLGEVLNAAKAGASDPESIRLALDSDLPLVEADAAQLERAFANLIENAARYSGGGPVSVVSRSVGGNIVVRVVDQGPGIPESEWKRIFEPFQHGQAANTGLGARAGDRQWLRRGKRGADRARVAAGTGHELRGHPAAACGAYDVNEATRVLVCDDEPQILRALRVILRDAGYEAVTASTGEEALDRAAVKPPAAAILDLMLPDLDGVEVTKRLREWSEMPIIVLSAVGEEGTKVRALAAGADDYVTKPFGPPELVARLEAVLRRARPEEAEPTISAEGLEIDLAARAVRRDGEDGPPDPDRVRAAADARAEPRTADDPPRTAGRGLGAGVLRGLPGSARPHRQPAAQDRAAADGPRYIRTDPGVGYRFAALGRPSRNLYTEGRLGSCGLDAPRRMIGAWTSWPSQSPSPPSRSSTR